MPPKSAVNSKLQYVSVRKNTFTEGVRIGSAKLLKYWPHDTPSAEEMAEKGFYYTPTKTQGDQVTCFWCGKKEKNLQGEASISSVHFSHNSKCPYAVIFHFLTRYQSDDDMRTFWHRLVEENELPLSVLEPHSQMSVRLRLATFKNLWKFDLRRKSKVTARGMAQAGFFFAPVDPADDRVICMYCGCALSEWDVGDDPREEHENNSRAYMCDNSHPACYFLETLEEPVEEETSILSGAELQHIPSLDGPNPQEKPRSAPRISSDTSSPKPGPDSSADSPLNKSFDGLMNVMSPLLPGLLSSDAPPQNELDQFDLSIDQLSDHGTHLDKAPAPVRRYPRRKKQAVFGAKIKEEENNKSATSLVLEVRKEPVVDKPESKSHTPPTEDTGDLLAPLAVDSSSEFHHSTSVSIPQNSTEDGDYAESDNHINSLQNLPENPEPSNNSAHNKASRSRFSDDQFGLNEKDIANILNSPKKDRKIRVVQKKHALPLPAIHDLSDQNIGDYDEQNLSFLEKDLRLQPVEQTSKNVDLEQENSDFQASSSPQKRPLSFKLPTSQYSAPDSSLVEIIKPESTKSVDLRETILVESPEKAVSVDHTFPADDDDVAEIILENLGPEKKHPVSETTNMTEEDIDDDIILDYESPQKPSSDMKVEPAIQPESDPISESTGLELEIDIDNGNDAEDVGNREKRSEVDRESLQSRSPPSDSQNIAQNVDTTTRKDTAIDSSLITPLSADLGEELKTILKPSDIKGKAKTESSFTASPVDKTGHNDEASLDLKPEETEPKQPHENGKRSIGKSLDEPVAKKQKGEEQPMVELSELVVAKRSLAGGIENTNTGHDKSGITQSGESPTKEVVISPSSYREYMSDYEKMKEEFVNTSTDEADITKSGSSTSGEKKFAESDHETARHEAPTNPILKETEPVKVQGATQKKDKPSPQDDEKELPSYIGDSASEAHPLLSVPPSPQKSGIEDKSTRSHNGDMLEKVTEEESKISTTRAVENKAGIPKWLESQGKSSSFSAGKGKGKDTLGAPKKEVNPFSIEEPKNLSTNINIEDRLSFLGVQSSTPNKSTLGDSNAKNTGLPRVSLNAALAEIKELEGAIEYVTEIAAQGYELHNDVDGSLTNFISAMPEEEEEMTIENWIQHNAKSCRKIVSDLADRMIQNYQADFDRVIEYVENLETID